MFQCDDTRGGLMQFWPPDDEHMCSKHVEAWNKFIVKQKFCVSSWLITEKKKCVLDYATTFFPSTALILRSIQRDITVNEHRSSWKVPVILNIFQSNLLFLDSFSTNTNFHENIEPTWCQSDVWLTVHRNSVWIRKTN